jgi:pilus assembly protein CpaF
MSDVELPVYVARAQVASAIHLVVQLSRFSEDGSRKVTRITEVFGLDESNQYQSQDLFVNRLTGRDDQGMLTADLSPTGNRPTFADELSEYALEDRARLTRSIWQA